MTKQLKLTALLLLTGLLAGCGTAPGMYMRNTGSNSSSPFTPATPEPVIDFTLVQLTGDNVGKYADLGTPGNPAATNTSPKLTATETGPYRLGLQDVLRINVWGQPDFLPTLSAVSAGGVSSVPLGRTINEDGKLFFPLIGSIPAVGLTVPEFRANLTKALAKFVKDPQIDVDVAAFRSQRVFLAGEVKTPGVVAITDIQLKIADALAAVGGTTAEADLGTIQLTRGNQSITLDLNRLYFGGDISNNHTLQHGDILTVPDRQARKVFLLGEVMQPKSYLLHRGRVSLAEVLADAGGTNPLSANAGEVYVMRRDASGKPLVFQLDARQPVALLVADRFDLLPRDLVYVNPTGATQAIRILNQYLPFLQGVTSAKAVGNL
jgi:polysaccharide export outer membrane protein